MHASKPTPVLLSRVIVLEFSEFQEPLYDRSKEKRFHVLQLLEAKLVLKRIYPDIVQVSGTFWQKSSPAIDHWNGVIECFAILQSIVSPMLSKEEICAFKRL